MDLGEIFRSHTSGIHNSRYFMCKYMNEDKLNRSHLQSLEIINIITQLNLQTEVHVYCRLLELDLLYLLQINSLVVSTSQQAYDILFPILDY